MSFAQKSEKKWTEEEDDILRAAVAEYGSKLYTCAHSIAPGRSNKSCRKRWIHSLDPSLRKGRWTSNEDAVLLDAVSQHGQNWSKVARHVEGRTDDQCAKRWRENLDPAISREPWTQEEDKILLEALRVHGQKWNTISTLLPGRASVHCRNRYSRLRRARDTQAPGESRTSSPGEGDVEQASSSSYPTPVRWLRYSVDRVWINVVVSTFVAR
ncbi:hypothetical protein GLOTRDRAFT_48068 [Gloeophyllum trabeum ATCC 11539]|uniref:Homeodomain-like protein n=1 Tax=Gloeophyllum trabeum (strain ATCC 11539 / FP-39264 / Madison 617) TaxID=670483 RepID=S7PVS2_GLOTA|nr:uncharacterized protein GLOTRDRAFT_48068 [Gloeophyllum trabeum ATCC 11539]EPQ51731.1 hypothetical protein GLOTRDRAFT_48068 [Gloeophyllum trabeum ATCC 11539]